MPAPLVVEGQLSTIASVEGGTPVTVETSGGVELALDANGNILVTDPIPTSGFNPSLTISNTDTVEASTKLLTKTSGSSHWHKTISYNAAGDIIAVSVWS